MLNDILQIGAVTVLLIYCIVWIIRRIKRKPANCGDGPDGSECSDCPLARNCGKRK